MSIELPEGDVLRCGRSLFEGLMIQVFSTLNIKLWVGLHVRVLSVFYIHEHELSLNKYLFGIQFSRPSSPIQPTRAVITVFMNSCHP
ncbi:MAG: hypothetical protein QXE81_01475 [Desulfurococcaceae archaeon]